MSEPTTSHFRNVPTYSHHFFMAASFSSKYTFNFVFNSVRPICFIKSILTHNSTLFKYGKRAATCAAPLTFMFYDSISNFLATEVNCNCDYHQDCLNNDDETEQLECELPPLFKWNASKTSHNCSVSCRPNDVR